MIQRTAFTLVELLVVIAIIGILVSLLLPAVQSAREAARNMQCKNHLKQMGLAGASHEAAHGFYPSSGWGYRWVGDADSGFGKTQPGGWVYQILPFMEQENLHALGRGGTAAEKKLAAEQLVRTPLPWLHCPSRRRPKLYPHKPDTASTNRPYNPGIDGVRTDDLTDVARTDYAINGGGDLVSTQMGPSTLAEAATYGWLDPGGSTGVSYLRSEFTSALLRDGTSNTYFVGEKYLNADSYGSWDGIGDAQTAYMGFDPDIARFGSQPPRQDRAGFSDDLRFGSAHAGGFNAVFCDGSVQSISYSIDADVHYRLAHRSDGQPVDVGSL